MDSVTALVDRSRTGEADAFEELVRRFQNMAYGYAYAVLGDFHLAEDIAQEAFIEAYLHLPDLKQTAAFPGWFRRIVHKHADRIIRSRRGTTTQFDEHVHPSDEPSPEELAIRTDRHERVMRAVLGLPDGQRAAVTLFYIDGYTQAEVSGFLEIPVTAVKKRLHDARKKLKQGIIDLIDESLGNHSLPDDFADAVVRKATSQDDLDRAAQLLAYHAKQRPDDFATPKGAEDAGVYIVGPEGQVDGAGYFTEAEFCIGSTVLRAVRPDEIGGEAEGVPDPSFVRSCRACLNLARERGIHISVAHGSQFDHAFCGFVPTFFYPVVTLPVCHAESITTTAVLSLAKEPEVSDACAAFLRDPYAPKLSAWIGGGSVHTIRESDQVVGYARLNETFSLSKNYGMPFGYVTDVTVPTGEAALAVIKRASELVGDSGGDEICMMQSHMTRITQAMLALGGTYTLRPSCDSAGLDAEMVAIVDLVGLTNDLAAELQSRVSGRLHSAARLSIQMGDEAVGFVVESGRLRIVSERQPVHTALPRWVVTRLYMGYHSGEDVLAMGPIPWDRGDGHTPDDPESDMVALALPDAEALLFGTLFPRMWPVSWPDPDVWLWVIGQDHPRYQNEDRKSDEMKAQIDALQFPWFGR
jgi:RNA polymerase sigma factor (sigma-70 family)